MERGMNIMNWVQVFFVHKRVVLAAKRVEFVTDRISYIMLKGRWSDIIIITVHAPTENIKKNTQTLTDASKEVGQEVNKEKTEYMLILKGSNDGG